MTTFHDGPADGRTLMLKRAPRFLRVVQSRTGTLDALDALDDKPAPDETIYAYEITGTPTSIHIRARGNTGGFYTVADYRFYPNQPEDAEMRGAEQWQAWCRHVAPLTPTITARTRTR